jgi:hypothetical protein
VEDEVSLSAEEQANCDRLNRILDDCHRRDEQAYRRMKRRQAWRRIKGWLYTNCHYLIVHSWLFIHTLLILLVLLVLFGP